VTPDQHQQLMTLMTEIVENRRESLQLQREGFRIQQEAIAMQRDTLPSADQLLKRSRVVQGVALAVLLIALAIGLFVATGNSRTDDPQRPRSRRHALTCASSASTSSGLRAVSETTCCSAARTFMRISRTSTVARSAPGMPNSRATAS